MQPHGSGDERDIAMAQRGQVLHTLADAVVIIDFEQADAGTVRPLIDKHHGDVALGELLQQRLLDAERHHRDSLGLALQHAPDAQRHARRVVVGGADQDLVAILDGDIFESLNEFREEWIGDFRNDQAKEPGAPGDQRPRLAIGEIIQLADGLPHALGHLGIHGRHVIDGAGNSGDGHIGPLGHGANIHEQGLLLGAPGGFGLFGGHGTGVENAFTAYARFRRNQETNMRHGESI